MTSLAALLTLLSADTPEDSWRANLLATVEPETLRSLGSVLAAAIALCLTALSRSIAAGTRCAVDVAGPLLLVVAVLNLLRGARLRGERRGPRGRAPARAGTPLLHPRRNVRTGLAAGAIAIGAVSAAYAVSLGTALVGGPGHEPRSVLGVGVSGAVRGSWFMRSGTPLAIALDLAVAAGLVAAGVFIHGLLRPEPSHDGHRPHEHRCAAAIVSRYDDHSLDPFALREDKAFFFADGGVLAYCVLRETAVVSGGGRGISSTLLNNLAIARLVADSPGDPVVGVWRRSTCPSDRNVNVHNLGLPRPED